MPGEITLHGRPVYRGIIHGRLYLDLPEETVQSPSDVDADVDKEIERLDLALQLVREHLEEHVRSAHLASAEDLHRIVAAHQLVLDDHLFFSAIRERIRVDRLVAEEAVEEGFGEVVRRLAVSRDTYLRGRVEDLRDICQTLREAMEHGADRYRPALRFDTDTIWVTAHLHPSVVLRARQSGAAGLVTSSRAFSSHGVILLRASELPSVAGVPFVPAHLRQVETLLLDGSSGEVIFDPEPPTVVGRRAAALVAPPASAQRAQPTPLHAASGELVTLWANIDDPEQVRLCNEHGLHGIGLLRTEFLVMTSGRPPDEEEQFQIYRDVIDGLYGRPLVARTFDLGGGKVVASLQHGATANPALGLRGLRRHLRLRPTELRVQLRALMRASLGHDTAVLLPMVSHPGDLVAARAHIDEVHAELEQEGLDHNGQIKVATMVEVPSAALQLPELLELCDFVAVGTNDLSQYLGAADRDNAGVADYLLPENTGILRLLDMMLEQARALGRVEDIRIGGELASDPESARRLVELGVRHLIVVPQLADTIRQAVAQAEVRPR